MMRLLILSISVWLALLPGQTKRQAEIARTTDAIQKECQRYGGGDWQRWFAQLSTYRDQVQALMDEALAHPRVSPDGKDKIGILKAKGNPPLFVESLSAGYLCLYHYHDRVNHEVFLKERSSPAIITAVSRWLAKKNIDLIFVPVPKMGEVYPDRMVEPVPPDRIVAPHVRRMIYDLLKANVEVVDLLPAYLKAREENPSPLYHPADPHWTDRAERIAALEIARHLERYAFVQAAKAQQPKYKTEELTIPFRGAFWNVLTQSERDEIGNGIGANALRVIRTSKGTPVEAEEHTPVLVMGDSYTNYTNGAVCPGCGITAHLARGVNQPISVLTVAGGTTEPVKELLRNQDLLEKRKVLVWIIQNASFTNDWPALPVLMKLATSGN